MDRENLWYKKILIIYAVDSWEALLKPIVRPIIVPSKQTAWMDM